MCKPLPEADPTIFPCFTRVPGKRRFAPKGQPSIARGVNPWQRSANIQTSPEGAAVVPPSIGVTGARGVWLSAPRSIALSWFSHGVIVLFPGDSAPSYKRCAAPRRRRRTATNPRDKRRLVETLAGNLLKLAKTGEKTPQLRVTVIERFTENPVCQHLPHIATGSAASGGYCSNCPRGAIMRQKRHECSSE